MGPPKLSREQVRRHDQSVCGSIRRGGLGLWASNASKVDDLKKTTHTASLGVALGFDFGLNVSWAMEFGTLMLPPAQPLWVFGLSLALQKTTTYTKNF